MYNHLRHNEQIDLRYLAALSSLNTATDYDTPYR